MATRRCSECGASLEGRSASARTCSPAHRRARSRRKLKNEREHELAQDLPEHEKKLHDLVASPDIAEKLVKEELRPVIREAITEDVLRSINDLVGLTGIAVDKIREDLESSNVNVRQRAYQSVIKYTVGHPALVRPDDDSSAQSLTVNFALPRPGDIVEHVESTIDSGDTKECDICGEDKQANQFVANSTRCRDCFDKTQKEVEAKYSDEN